MKHAKTTISYFGSLCNNTPMSNALMVRLGISGLREANLRGADLGEANLRKADLGGANLGGADLGRADLRGANLWGADLGGADLREANLRGADLREADLRGADLREADLGEANLGGVNLRGADLGGVNLGGANLRGANLGGANLRGADLRGADLRGADLGGADLWKADLRGVNLSHTKGLLDTREWLTNHLEYIGAGLICYKSFGHYFSPPTDWVVKEGEIIKEVVNQSPVDECGCGINVATLEWTKEYAPSSAIWKCLIPIKALCTITVPYNTDGKFRVGCVKLLYKVDSNGNKLYPEEL